MRSLSVFGISAALSMMLAQGCGRDPEPGAVERPKVFAHRLELGQRFELIAAPFRTGGFPSNERCMEGSYIYRHETNSPQYGREVWLCCVPVEELLRESFQCAGEILAPLFFLGDADLLKIRYCYLYDAQSTELRLIPACIPAPLEAPGVGEP